jgi:hypothetical protein
MTLAQILATFPAGSDERLNALAAWRKAEDERLGANPPVQVPVGKRLLERPPKIPEEIARVFTNEGEARAEWERRREAAERQRGAEAAAAMRARVTKVAELTAHRINALPDMATRKEKMRRLAELQTSIMENRDSRILAIISRSFSEIEARLARLTAE